VTDTALITSNVDPDIAAAMTVYERLKPLQDALGLKDLTVPEMQLFAMVAHHTGLDPFTKQIYAIKRGGKVTHQTGIDGYRSTAARTTEYAGSDEAEFEPCSCGSDDSPREHPALARVVVHRILPNGHVVNQPGIARWHELKPKHTKNASGYGFADDMWWQMPWNQLAKCAEANGLRKAFPRVLAGVYIADEMGQAETIEGQSRPVAPTARERIAARRQRAQQPPDEAIDAEFTEHTPPTPGTGTPGESEPAVAAAPNPGGAAAAVGINPQQFIARAKAFHLGNGELVRTARSLFPDAAALSDLTDAQRQELLDVLVEGRDESPASAG